MKKLLCLLLAILMILPLAAGGAGTDDPAHDGTQGSDTSAEPVYERNAIVQEELGINYEFYGETVLTQVAYRHAMDIQSGQGDYDIIVNG